MSFGPFRTLGLIWGGVQTLVNQGKLIMSAIDDLKAADAANAQATKAALDEISSLQEENATSLAKIAALATAAAPDDTADIEAEVAAMNDRTAKISAGIAAVQGAVAATPATAPAGVVVQGMMGSGVRIDPNQSNVQGGGPITGDSFSASSPGVAPEQATSGATAPKDPDAGTPTTPGAIPKESVPAPNVTPAPGTAGDAQVGQTTAPAPGAGS